MRDVACHVRILCVQNHVLSHSLIPAFQRSACHNCCKYLDAARGEIKKRCKRHKMRNQPRRCQNDAPLPRDDSAIVRWISPNHKNRDCSVKFFSNKAYPMPALPMASAAPSPALYEKQLHLENAQADNPKVNEALMAQPIYRIRGRYIGFAQELGLMI